MANILKLLKTWLSGLKNSTLIDIAFVVGIIIVLFSIKGYERSKAIIKYDSALAVWQHKNDSLSHVNDILIKKNKDLNQWSVTISAFADSIKKHDQAVIHDQQKTRPSHDSTFATLQHTLPDTCKQALVEAAYYRNEADNLLVTVNNEMIRGDSLKVLDDSLVTQNGRLLAMNDSLVAQLFKVPVYREPKLLGLIPYPTRKQSFGVGVGLGILATVLIAHQLH